MNSLKLNILVLILPSLYSCAYEEGTISVNIGNNSYKEISIDINNYFDNDIKVVKLQTDDSCLVPGSAKIFPGNESVYIYSIDRILQFSYSGKFIKNIPIAKKTALVALSLINDSTLLCFPQRSSYSYSESLAFFQNLNGNLISDVLHNTEIKEGPVMRRRPDVINNNGNLLYLANNTDTIYKIEQTTTN